MQNKINMQNGKNEDGIRDTNGETGMGNRDEKIHINDYEWVHTDTHVFACIYECIHECIHASPNNKNTWKLLRQQPQHCDLKESAPLGGSKGTSREKMALIFPSPFLTLFWQQPTGNREMAQ